MTLETRYNTTFGTKTSKGALYGGFTLLIFGMLLGLAALILFFIGYNDEGASIYKWRRGALTIGAASLPFMLLGIAQALPTKTAMRILSYVGFGLCLLMTLLFAIHYPDNFNVQDSQVATQKDYTALDTGLYAAGLALMLASSFTSIIGYYVDRMRPAGAAEEEDDDYGSGYEVPDWVVERDIEYAMKKYGVSWGEGPVTDTGMQVNIPDSLGANVKIGGLGKARVVQLDAEQVDSGVKQLSGVRPNKKGSLPSEWADEATSALVAFRKQKAANPTMYRAKRSWWARFVDFVTGRNRRPVSAGGNLGSVPSTGPSRAPAAKPRTGPSSNGAAPGPRRGTTIVIEDEATEALPRKGKKN